MGPTGYGGINYYVNDGAGNFERRDGDLNPFFAIDGKWSSQLALCDWDGDGTLELAFGTSQGNIRYFTAPADRGAVAVVERFGSENPFSAIDVDDDAAPFCHDVDGDGDHDLVVGTGQGGQLRFYVNDGSGVAVERTGSENPFHAFASRFGRFYVPALGDLDGDGFDDLAIGTYGAAIVAMKMRFDAADSYTERLGDLNPLADVEARYLSFGDVTGDGRPDVVALDNAGTIRWYENTGVGFEGPNAFPFSVFGYPSVFDADADGRNDVVFGLADGSLAWWRHEGYDARDGSPLFVQGDAATFAGVNAGGGDDYDYAYPAHGDFGDGAGDALIVGGRVHNIRTYRRDDETGAYARVAGPFDDQHSGNARSQLSWSSWMQSMPCFGPPGTVLVGGYGGEVRTFTTTSGVAVEILDGEFAFVDVGFASSPEFADWDGDGLAELVVADMDSMVAYFDRGRCIPEKPCNGNGLCPETRAAPTCVCLTGLDGPQCVDCVGGFECDIEAGRMVPVAAGSFLDGGAAACAKCGKVDLFPETGAAAECPPGAYSTAGQATCAAVAAGWYTENYGSAAPLKAESGSFSPDGTRVEACAPGTHAAAGGATVCEPCPAGTWSSAGATTCATAFAGTAVRADQWGVYDCPAGRYSGDGASRCLRCEPGRVAANASSTLCATCSAGRVSSTSSLNGLPIEDLADFWSPNVAGAGASAEPTPAPTPALKTAAPSPAAAMVAAICAVVVDDRLLGAYLSVEGEAPVALAVTEWGDGVYSFEASAPLGAGVELVVAAEEHTAWDHGCSAAGISVKCASDGDARWAASATTAAFSVVAAGFEAAPDAAALFASDAPYDLPCASSVFSARFANATKTVWAASGARVAAAKFVLVADDAPSAYPTMLPSPAPSPIPSLAPSTARPSTAPATARASTRRRIRTNRRGPCRRTGRGRRSARAPRRTAASRSPHRCWSRSRPRRRSRRRSRRRLPKKRPRPPRIARGPRGTPSLRRTARPRRTPRRRPRP